MTTYLGLDSTFFAEILSTTFDGTLRCNIHTVQFAFGRFISLFITEAMQKPRSRRVATASFVINPLKMLQVHK